jgi:phage tail-like protein
MNRSPSRNANDATWYVLQYGSDFREFSDPALKPWSPTLDHTALLYDNDRHVLELLPVPPTTEAEPLPGLAVDVNGQVYRVDPITGRVLVRCGQSDRELLCERGSIASAAGLALDRRGLLYVADPPAHRVLVVVPDDGSLAGVLAGGLEEPVDVAVAPDGWIYVADRRAGRIVAFNSRFTRCHDFAPRDSENVIDTPRPIAVMIDDDGAVVVADAAYPRLLRFTPKGTLLGDIESRALAQRSVRIDPLERAYASAVPRFYAGTCGPCRPSRDGGDALAAVHRSIRIAHLSLRRTFSASGTFVSAPLDGGTPGVQWHKVVVDADIPDGTWIKVQTATADNASGLADPGAIAFDDADADLRPPSVADRLIFSPPGRWLRLRVILGSDGSATPTVRAIRVFHPRVSYLDLLPRVYRRDRESAFFLEHFLALFEHVFTGIEDRYELFTRQLNPGAAPVDVLNWLACLIDLSFDPSWPLARRRALVEAAQELYATRGTPRGLSRYVEIYTGQRPVIIEGFLERPQQAPFLGLPGMILGATTHLTSTRRRSTPEELLLSRWAHRFSVLVFLDDECDEEITVPVVDRIVSVNKPAHTFHRLRVAPVGARVGVARLGLDVTLGARQALRTRLAGCDEDGHLSDRASVLGTDAVLGAARPAYARALALSL